MSKFVHTKTDSNTKIGAFMEEEKMIWTILID